MRNIYALIALCTLVAVAGCQRTVGPFQSEPAPLTPAPVGNVQSGQLGTPGDFPEAPATTAPPAEEYETAAAGAPDITRESLVGRWTVSSSGSSCDLFLALTKWTGGYRAATRGCNNEAALVSAWDVNGKQVVLSDNSGNQFARLYKSGEERYEGQTTSGQSISLSR
jgi:hypothetical protein